MRLSDLTIEVRNKKYKRIGAIPLDDVTLKYTGQFNNVGSWELTLPSDHPMVTGSDGTYSLKGKLNDFGAGIIVSVDGEEIFSGPLNSPEFAATPEDLDGSITFSGITDDCLLAERICYPDPASDDFSNQTKAHDERSGPAETVMQGYVRANLGDLAPYSRQVSALVMSDDRGRGLTVKKSARFQVLGDLLNEIALPSGLGFRLIQRGDFLVFETYEIRNKTKELAFSIEEGSISGMRYSYAAPSVTRALVAGQGDLTARQMLERSTTESLQAEADWGRRIEAFIDQRQTDDMTELQQAGDEALAEGGFTSYNIQAVPQEDEWRRFGTDWYLGDRVTVRVNRYPFPTALEAAITGVALVANTDGLRVGMLLGDPTAFDEQAQGDKRTASLENRLSDLERADAGGGSAKFGALVRSTAILNLTTATYADIPGVSVTVTSPGPSAVFTIEGGVDAKNVAGKADVVVGQLLVDGVVQSGQIILAAPLANFRGTVGQRWRITGLASGAHTIKMQAGIAPGTLQTGSQWFVYDQHTSMLVQQVA